MFCESCSSAFLLPTSGAMKPIYEAIVGHVSAFATRALTDGRTLAADLDILHFSAITLILILLMTRIAKRYCRFRKSFVVGSTFANTTASGRFVDRQHLLAVKKCPSCAERLPLSALMCDACDYNFLSGRGQKLLPSPEPTTHERSKQSLASGGLGHNNLEIPIASDLSN